MSWRINVILFILIQFSCQPEKTPVVPAKEAEIRVDIVPNLIEADQLKVMAVQPHVKIIDFRKKVNYEEGHIAEALNVWRSDIEDISFDYGGMMATPKQLETLFSKLGINSDDTLVIYDDNGLCDASRLWWLLQNYNFKNVKLMQGGLDAWKNLAEVISNDLPNNKETEFKLDVENSMQYYISKEEMEVAVERKALIIDARTLDEFTGRQQKKGAAKAGRIPNSVHLDWAEAINYNGDKKIKSKQELEKVYNKLNTNKEDPIIVYCHSGVRSAHTTFVLTQILGYKNVRNYDGSWTEWSHDDELPIEIDTKIIIEQ